MTWPQSVDEALCFGWIDGHRKGIDELSYKIRFSPRKKGSIWSAVNIAKVASLTAEGRMTEAGLAAFALRSNQRSGVYSYEQTKEPVFSAEHLAALELEPNARDFLSACPRTYRRTVTHWVTTAKLLATRERRFLQLLEASRAGRRLPQFS